ncbi:MAG: hypothetical protein F4X57_04895 [Chloroflexi bacterium]|nr:hypothetical protein [Chloroflexota bacterium]
MIYEERRVIVDAKRLNEYLSVCQSDMFPAIRGAGGNVICQLSGLIGNPQNELVQITSWRSLYSWEKAQSLSRIYLDGLCQSEEVRLFRAISSRPKSVIPEGDRRPVYGFRRFFIQPGDLKEFVHCSENGIWPRIESMGASILGLWTTLAVASPMEIVLVTGYRSPSHWEQTRYDAPRHLGVARELWDNENALRRRRVEMTQKSWVCLMQAHDVS